MAEKQILVVDNEEDQLQLFQAILTKFGSKPTVTGSPEHALKLLQAGSFNAAIVDLVMPDMDGHELCERIHRSHPDLPVYALSGYGDLCDQDRLEEAGFDGLIPKPVRLLDVKKILDAVFSDGD
jgi:CheY-like chemotaxis protein